MRLLLSVCCVQSTRICSYVLGSAVDFIDTTLRPLILILGVFPLKTLLYHWKETNLVGWISKGLSTSHSIRWAKNVTTWERSPYKRDSHDNVSAPFNRSGAFNRSPQKDVQVEDPTSSDFSKLVARCRETFVRETIFFAFIKKMMEWGAWEVWLDTEVIGTFLFI